MRKVIELLQLFTFLEAEDIEYWEKLNNDRTARFQQKKQKKRGTQKVFKNFYCIIWLIAW